MVPDLRNTTYLGIGYVANLPNTFAGASLLAISPKVLGGAGVYADVKLSTSSLSNDPYYMANVTPNQALLQFGDNLFEDQKTYVTVDLALVYSVTPEFALYGGAGYGHRTQYQHYYDDSEVRGDFGWYWVRNAEESGARINLMGGGFFRLGSWVAFQGGVESQPVGATVGMMLTLPVG